MGGMFSSSDPKLTKSELDAILKGYVSKSASDYNKVLNSGNVQWYSNVAYDDNNNLIGNGICANIISLRNDPNYSKTTICINSDGTITNGVKDFKTNKVISQYIRQDIQSKQNNIYFVIYIILVIILMKYLCKK